jgi:hypothetical protein
VILGAVADAVNLETALVLSAAAPAVGVVLCLRLPAPARRQPVREPARSLALGTDA